MKESRDGISHDRISKSSSVSSIPLILDIDDFKVNTEMDLIYCHYFFKILVFFIKIVD